MSATECQYCGNAIVKGDKTFHEEYFGGKNIYCSRKCVIEGFFFDMINYYTKTHKGTSSNNTYIYHIKFEKDVATGETTLIISRENKVTGRKEAYSETLSSDVDKMYLDTISTFFSLWETDFYEKDFSGEPISPFSRELLCISPNQINTSNYEGKEFRELLIDYQEKFI